MPRRPVSIQSGDSIELRPEPRLLKAVEANDVIKVKHAIEDVHANLDLHPNLLSIGLVRACDKNHVDIAKYLLTRGANPDYSTGNKPPPLLRAAEYGLMQIAETLIDHGAKLEARDSKKKMRTALMTAAWKGNFDVVKLLITRGAQIETLDMKTRNVLHNVAADNAPKASRRCTMEIVHYLLQAGVNLDARDSLGRTSVHWTVVTDHEELLKILLTSRFGEATLQARCNATDTRMKTPLHLAASNNRAHLIELLLTHGADVHAKSDGGWTALHNACQSGSGSMVQALLDAGANVNQELLNGRTPLHVAAEFGNAEAAECLLERPDIKRSVKDRFGISPLLMAAQHGKKDIAEMLAPWRHTTDLSDDEKEAAKQFMATIVDFGNFRNENRVMRRSVYELLYARDVRDASKHMVSTVPKDIKGTDFRWIHLPANNIGWCDALLTKRFLQEGANDIEGYKALEASFSHQHRGQKHHSRFMRPMCQVVNRSAAEIESEGVETPAVIVEEPGRLGNIPDTPTSVKENERPSKSTASKEYQAVPGAELPHASKSKARQGKPPRRNTVDTVSTLAASDASIGTRPDGKGFKPHVKRQETTSTVANSESSSGKKGGNPVGDGFKSTKQQRKAAARPQARVSLDKSPSKRGHGSDCNIFLFMPYLHFETHRRRREMQRAMDDPDKLLSPAAAADQVLIRAHLSKSSSFLHVRRTLDQFFYHNIDTELRDCDQVVYRFQKKHKDENVDPKIFMVDQLWMWILGKDLVVTSFPQRWRQPRNDPLNVLEGIIEDINSKTREPVQNVYELAATIAGRCLGTFDRHQKGASDFQFLDMFEASIGAAMDSEASLFQKFSKASCQASEWLRSHQKPTRFSKALEADRKADDHAAKKQLHHLQSKEHERETLFVDNLLDVGAETDLLAEIKDIRDELDIIRMVLGHQQHLLPDLQKAIVSVYKDERSYPQERKANKVFEEQEKFILNPLKDIDRMDKQAERIYEAIRDLLDLKQKHANALEARFARDQAAGTQRQGQTLMVFTIVTVIFLPLSFVAAFFAINVEQFPHPAWAGGNQVLPLSTVSAYVFGIGLAISVPCIAIALTVEEINHSIAAAKRKIREKWLRWKIKRDPEAEHELDAMKINHTLSMVKRMRRSLDVNVNGKAVSPSRASVESQWERGYAYRRASKPGWDVERGRRNARTDTIGV